MTFELPYLFFTFSIVRIAIQCKMSQGQNRSLKFRAIYFNTHDRKWPTSLSSNEQINVDKVSGRVHSREKGRLQNCMEDCKNIPERNLPINSASEFSNEK
jgi:hypothetical protein